LSQLYIYTGIFFLAGFILAWAIRSFTLGQIKKQLKSVEGFLESEKRKKETLQKENVQVNNMRLAGEAELIQKLKDAQKLIHEMENDILLLQKSNEETEALLEASQPEIYNLKLKLIEAGNTIARYKSQLGK